MESAPTTEADWIRLFRSTVPRLLAGVLRRTGGDRDLAEDVTQETWLRALEDWRRKVPSDPAAWLTKVARNLLHDHYRRRRPEAVAPELLEGEPAWIEPRTPDAAALLQWGLSGLNSKQAALLEAFHLDGKGVATLASELELSERAVEGRLRRSRIALRRRLTPYIEAIRR